jgi:PP-loop superfamily ATP-utilizing enzyme
MVTQPLSYRPGLRADQRANIKHPLATLLTKKAAITLYKQNKEALDLVLKVGRHQIDAAPGSEINRAKVQPDLLPFGTIHRAHTQ